MSLFQDVRFAVRMIRKRPAVSAIVVLTLGLGIGANGISFAMLSPGRPQAMEGGGGGVGQEC